MKKKISGVAKKVTTPDLTRNLIFGRPLLKAYKL